MAYRSNIELRNQELPYVFTSAHGNNRLDASIPTLHVTVFYGRNNEYIDAFRVNALTARKPIVSGLTKRLRNVHAKSPRVLPALLEDIKGYLGNKKNTQQYKALLSEAYEIVENAIDDSLNII